MFSCSAISPSMIRKPGASRQLSISTRKNLYTRSEYRDVSPEHEVNADGGLMLYGRGTEILPGTEGRYHRERLHVSPYIYREAEDGSREWNADYAEDGFYYDPIYDGISVDLG